MAGNDYVARPAHTLGDADTRVMLAVIDGCRTLPEVMLCTGLPHHLAYSRLRHLRAVGLVDYQPGRKATLRPRYRTVGYKASPLPEVPPGW